jgi:hypothetical protein
VTCLACYIIIATSKFDDQPLDQHPHPPATKRSAKMVPRPSSNYDQWLEDTMRRMFAQTRNASGGSASGSTGDEAVALQAARDARRMVKMALQMAMAVLEAADEKQDEADGFLQSRIASEKERYRVEKGKRQRLARENQQLEIEWARQSEVEGMRRAMEQLQQKEKEQERVREEMKREERRRREVRELRAAQQEVAEALKKAQAEAKKYREAAERANQEANRARGRAERAEEAQRQHTGRTESGNTSKESAAWTRYTEQWDLFKRFAFVAGAGSSGGVFRFEDIPWPMLSSPTTPGMITKKDVEAFLYSSSAINQGKPLKTRIRECLLIWHPDKFSGRQVIVPITWRASL